MWSAMRATDLSRELAETPVIGIIRNQPPAQAIRTAHRLWDSGVRAVEVTIEVPSALPTLAAVAIAARARGALIGAGSVIGLSHLSAALDCGVDFTVSPGLDPAVARAAGAEHVIHIPGVSSSTEIMQALDAGVSIVKAFPASNLGPEWVRAQSAPFPGLEFIATGGLTVLDVAVYRAAGCLAIGVSDRNIPQEWRASPGSARGRAGR